METFLCVALCFSLVALGFSAGMLIRSSQKDTVENYFGAILGEMLDQTRQMEKMSAEIETLKTDTHECIPEAEEIDDYYSSPGDTGEFVTMEIPTVSADNPWNRDRR
jgi:hypothetical protein